MQIEVFSLMDMEGIEGVFTITLDPDQPMTPELSSFRSMFIDAFRDGSTLSVEWNGQMHRGVRVTNYEVKDI